MKWAYSQCEVCKGTGQVLQKDCPVCEGEGMWEFPANFTEEVLRALNLDAQVSPEAKAVCDQRIQAFTPDDVDIVLGQVNQGDSFEALHEAGAFRWGCAWLHTNRFAIELCKLCGGDHVRHRESLSVLSWLWLEREGQQKPDRT